MISLQASIEETLKGLTAQAPQKVIENFTEGLADLVAADIDGGALSVWTRAPEFSLPDFGGTTITLESRVQRGPVVLQFFRGSWCPFCNLQLSALEDIYEQVKSIGAEILAITPERPDKTDIGQSRPKPSFPVLYDAGNRVASEYGIVFELNPHLKSLHQAMGSDLPPFNGDASWTLPIPATFIIDRDQIISWRFLDKDYTKRAEPADLLKNLKAYAVLELDDG